jgi:hypothetical protein
VIESVKADPRGIFSRGKSEIFSPLLLTSLTVANTERMENKRHQLEAALRDAVTTLHEPASEYDPLRPKDMPFPARGFLISESP